VLWANGESSQWDYTVQGVPGNRRLFLKSPGANQKPDEWVEGN